MDNNNKYATQIQSEQLELLYNGLKVSIPGSIMGASLFYGVYLYHGHKVDNATLWIILIFTVIAIRAIDRVLFLRALPLTEQSLPRWNRRFLIGSSAAGISWGLASWLIFPLNDPTIQALYIFGIAAVCTGALISLAFIWKNYFLFMLGAIGLLEMRLLYENAYLTNIMAMVLFFFWIYIALASRVIDKTTHQNIELRLRSDERESDLHRVQQRQQFHVQNTQLAVIEWDLQMKITEWNPAASRITGYSLEESLGEYLPSHISAITPGQPSRLATVWAHIQETHEPVSIEYPIQHQNGFERQCVWHVIPLLNNKDEVIGGASMALDITDKNAAQAKLMAAKEEAEKANQAKSEFLSSMSHELRTPLNAIIGFSQLLVSDAEDPDMLENAELINNAGSHLLNLINDLLDLEKIEAGKLSITTELVSVGLVLEECLPLILPQAEKNNITLDIDLPGCKTIVEADRMRLKQCFLNFMTNAVKYNKPGGSVTIRCEKKSEYLRINFTDTGFGISAEKQRNLFTPFDRLGRESGQIEGSGIGLVITKQLIEMMHGNLGIISTPDVGSTFWVELRSTGVEAHG